MKNYRRNNYIGKMKKGFKQKLSLLMIACLLFTGYRGLTISGRADSSHTEQNNEIEVSGTQVKVQLLGADLRRAATEAILKGEKVGKSNLRSYSKDQELATEFEEYFDGEKEIYNIPLNSIAENLEESLNAEEAGLQIYVERDAKDLDRLVRKESKESLLLYSKESAVAGLLPKKEEATTVSLTEEKASDSNLERNTELTGSELITFVYENKSTERMTFQLSVDGNKYPKVTVASKTSLFKQFLGDAKKAQAEAKNTKATEAKAESTEAQTVEASKAEEGSAEAKQEVAESKATEETKATEESKASEEARKDDSEVAIVSTAAEAVAESTEAKAEVKTEVSEEATEARVEATEAEIKETAAKAETAQAEKATEAQKAVVEDNSLLKDITEHSEEILPELQSIRFTQYSLNELGRKSQNVEIEGFGNVQVFYDEAAFDGDVVLEAKRLFKPEEEAEGEKLSKEQVKVLKEYSIYDGAASLDIRFVDKKDSAVEVEPKSPVSVRISIDKKALPAEVSPDAISIHHLVENDQTKDIERVETVVQSTEISRLESKGLSDDEIIDKVQEATNKKTNDDLSTLKKEEISSQKDGETITKEFTVNSFSLFQITYTEIGWCLPIRFHYVDKNFNEIGPTVHVEDEYYSGITYWPNKKGEYVNATFDNPKHIYFKRDIAKQKGLEDPKEAGQAMKFFKGYKFHEVYPFKAQLDFGDPKLKLTPEQQDHYLDHLDVNNANPGDYFDLRYKYSPGLKEFKEGVDFIDDTGFQTVNAKNNGYGVTRWVWYKNGQVQRCGTRDFYFVYDIVPITGFSRLKEDIEARHEKYITNNLDGTYDLTLTGQVKRKTKEKLDIVFLIDTSKNMNLPFDRKHGSEVITETDYDKNESSRKVKVQHYATQMVERLLQNPSYDLQFGIVGFGGSKTGAANIGKALNGGNVTDKAFDDITYVGGYTSSVEKFKTMIKDLPESQGDRTGTNYSAAIMGMRALIDGSFYTDLANTKRESLNGRREVKNGDARRIVIMLTDSDPVYSFIFNDEYENKNEGVKITNKYDETERQADGKLKSFVATLNKGDTYGNGVDFSRVALNQARGLLSMPNEYSAFYSIGVGNEENWRHLKELTEAHGPDQNKAWDKVDENRPDKFIQAQSPLAKNVESKVFNGSTPENLEESFNEITNLIVSSKATNISIEDTLSENVDLVENSQLKVEVYRLSNNGVEAEGEREGQAKPLSEETLKKMGLNKFETKVVGKKITLTTNPTSFSLPAGYEIRLTAKIKPSLKAYQKLKEGNAAKDEGGDRTDLNDIYKTYLKDTKYANDIKYNGSTHKWGLKTNDEAYFGFAYVDKNGNKQTPKLKYNVPIIKVKNTELKLEKQIKGLEGKAYLNSVGYTPLGISVLKDITFKVYEIDKDKTEKPYLTFKPYQDTISGEQSNAGEFQVDGKTIKRDKVKYDDSNDTLSLNFTITGLDSDKEYRVVETVNETKYVLKDSSTKSETEFKFTGKENDNSVVKLDGTVVKVKNNYSRVIKKKKISLEKEVKNKLGGSVLHPDDVNRDYDFYLRVYKRVERPGWTDEYIPFNSDELLTLRNSFGTLKGKFDDKTVEVPPNSRTYALHFQLKNGEKIEFELDDNLAYDFSEKKITGFDKPEIGKRDKVTEKWDPCTIVDSTSEYWYTCDRMDVNKYSQVKYVNKSTKIPTPTGIVLETAPYVLSIFGFVAMAGAYIAINKKRREA